MMPMTRPAESSEKPGSSGKIFCNSGVTISSAK
jgi:hypothetical protein